MPAMHTAERLAGDQPKPEKERGEITINEVTNSFLCIHEHALHDIIRVDSPANLIAETKVNNLPKPWTMQREDFAKNRCVTLL
jgi:hypothetical protein